MSQITLVPADDGSGSDSKTCAHEFFGDGFRLFDRPGHRLHIVRVYTCKYCLEPHFEALAERDAIYATQPWTLKEITKYLKGLPI